MLGHHVGLVHEFFDAEIGGDCESAHDAKHPDRPEEVQRARQILQQEADRHQIKEHTEGSRDSVMRSAALAVHVLDGDFDDRRAVPRGQRRNEAVHLSVERNLGEDVATIGLESYSEVMDIDAAQLCHEPVGAARWDAAQPEIVDAILAPAADDVVALGNFFEKKRNVGGIVLQVAVHGDDVFAARMVESGGEAGGLSEVAAQLDYRHAAVDSGDFAQQVKGTVDGAVIDENHFKAFA